MPLPDKLTRARAAMIMSQPFFASLALRMPMIPAPVGTMATDGKTIKFDPAFVETTPAEELVGVLAHEVMHCALLHHTRRGQRDPELWNKAADYAVNPIILNAKMALPESALVDPRFAGMSADEIYSILDSERSQGGGGDEGEDQQQGGSGSQGQPSAGGGQGGDDGDKASDEGGGSDPGGCGAVTDAPPGEGNPIPSPADLTEAEQDWKIAVMQAAQVAKAQGKLPAGIERLVEQLRQPSTDWRELLRRFFQQARPTDYQWTPPNRRFVGQGIYLPGMQSDALGTVAIAVDTSGSIGEEELEQFAAEINSILDEAKPEKVVVIYCDAKVQETVEYEPQDFPVKLEAKGGGGTAFEPAFDWLGEQGIEPAAFIYLTDLCGSFPADPPAYPVLWASTYEGQSAPFGETINITIQKGR